MKARSASLIGWLGIQLLVLSIGALRVPLTARSGSEPQRLAFPEMIVAQLAVSTLMFPLLGDRVLATVIALTSMPFLQLAGLLTGTSELQLFSIWLAVGVWLCGLAAWTIAIRSRQHRTIASSVLGTIVIGGPLMNYLVSEFSDSPEQSKSGLPAICDPMTTMLSQAKTLSFSAAALSVPSVLLLSGIFALALHRVFGSRAKLST